MPHHILAIRHSEAIHSETSCHDNTDYAMSNLKVAYANIFPYYLSGATAFVSASILYATSGPVDGLSYAHPSLIALTHCMTLGWGAMLIFGAGHQMLPVILNANLYSISLLKINFSGALTGVTLLIIGFYRFDMGGTTIAGSILFLISSVIFYINILMTYIKSNSKNIQGIFILCSLFWLIITCTLGVLQVINFNHFILPVDSFRLLNTHAHLGLIGFLSMAIIGVTSKLLPMFTLSKYQNDALMRLLLVVVQLGLASYLLSEWLNPRWVWIAWLMFAMATLLYIYFCFQTLRKRLRKHLETPIKTSLLFPAFILILLSLSVSAVKTDWTNFKVLYGLLWLMGGLASMLIGMSFKTLPFMAWNNNSTRTDSRLPKDLFKQGSYRFMMIMHLAGISSGAIGLLFSSSALFNLSKPSFILSSATYLYLILKIHRQS